MFVYDNKVYFMLGRVVIVPIDFGYDIEGKITKHDEESDEIIVETDEGDLYSGSAHLIVDY